jgi:hypothetical protein
MIFTRMTNCDIYGSLARQQQLNHLDMAQLRRHQQRSGTQCHHVFALPYGCNVLLGSDLGHGHS